jgi:hypothetical protein
MERAASWATLDIRVPQGLSGRGRRTPALMKFLRDIDFAAARQISMKCQERSVSVAIESSLGIAAWLPIQASNWLL